MKKGITISIALVLAVVVGGLSMGCIDAPVEVPDNGGLTANGLEVKADVAEREAQGFVQYTDEPTIVVEIVVVEVIEVVREYPVIDYCRCYVEYPENVAGFDTPKERAYIYQSMLNDKMDSLYTEGIAQQRYQYWGDVSYTEFYHTLYQDKQDSYQKLYCTLGNKILTDDNEPIVRCIGAFNFTSPWGNRSLGNGSFVYDTYEGKVSFTGSEEIASGGAVFVTEEGAIISNMYYTYMGNNATLAGNTEVTF